MRVLALDTSGQSLSLALCENGKTLLSFTLDVGLTHSETLMPWLDKALTQLGWQARSLQRIAAVVGPGSFTGVRIGVTTARALAQPFEIPCVAVNALDALAAPFAFLQGTLVCPMLDARAGQVYACALLGKARAIQDDAYALDAFLKSINEIEHKQLLFVGDGAVKHQQSIEKAFPHAQFPPLSDRVKAEWAALLAQESPTTPYARLTPYYLRKPQAERELEAKSQPKEQP